MKLTKKQKALLESLRPKINSIVKESILTSEEYKGDLSKIDIRTYYDTLRIINVIHDAFEHPNTKTNLN